MLSLRIIYFGLLGAALLFFCQAPELASLHFPEWFCWFDVHFVMPVARALKKIFMNPWFYAGTVAILSLERAVPVKRSQKMLSTGFLQDFAWVAMEAVTKSLVLVTFVHFLQSLYRTHLDFLTLHALDDVRWRWRFLIGVLLTDFLNWFHHWVRHKVPMLWQFHAIHHSQKEMNLFTDFRYHFVEYMVSNVIMVIPLMMIRVDIYSVMWFSLFNAWYTRLYHANIRSNFGPLRYLFVTPQSHRIHHSREPRHMDTNFGVLFSVWDRLFRTHYEGAKNEYPETGIVDRRFPHEKSNRPSELALTLIRQQLYPFVVIAQRTFLRNAVRKNQPVPSSTRSISSLET